MCGVAEYFGNSKNDLLSNDQLKKDGIFDPTSVKKLIKDDTDGYIDGTYSIFAIMCINLWIRKFV
jgi:asparagine synthase (glutamine-hydrolysing)